MTTNLNNYLLDKESLAKVFEKLLANKSLKYTKCFAGVLERLKSFDSVEKLIEAVTDGLLLKPTGEYCEARVDKSIVLVLRLTKEGNIRGYFRYEIANDLEERESFVEQINGDLFTAGLMDPNIEWSFGATV